MVLFVQRIIEILQLLDAMADVPVVRSTGSHVQLVDETVAVPRFLHV